MGSLGLKALSNTSAREILGIACLSLFVDSVGYGVVVPILPTYVLSLGASDYDLALIFSSFAMVQLFTTIPFGLFSDKYGRKVFMVTGMLLLGASFMYFPFAHSVLALIACRVVQGLAASATWSSALALVADAYPGGDKGEKLGIANGAVGLGNIAGPLVGGVLGDINFGLPFLVIGSVAFFACFYMLLRLKLERGEALRAPVAFREMLRGAIRVRNVLLVVFINLLIAVFFGFIEPLLPPYLSGRFNLSGTQIGLFFGGAFLTYVVSQPFVGRLSDRYGRKIFIVCGLIALSITNVMIPYLSDVLTLFALLVVMGVFWSLAYTPLMPLAVDSLRSKNRETFGTMSGFFNIAWNSGYSVGPLIGALVTSYFGFESIFWFFSGLLVVMIIVAQTLIAEKRVFVSKTSIKNFMNNNE
ncbi:MAG: MFS transporter [Candidatus Jordarchaeaceae archaeon]